MGGEETGGQQGRGNTGFVLLGEGECRFPVLLGGRGEGDSFLELVVGVGVWGPVLGICVKWRIRQSWLPVSIFIKYLSYHFSSFLTHLRSSKTLVLN